MTRINELAPGLVPPGSTGVVPSAPSADAARLAGNFTARETTGAGLGALVAAQPPSGVTSVALGALIAAVQKMVTGAEGLLNGTMQRIAEQKKKAGQFSESERETSEQSTDRKAGEKNTAPVVSATQAQAAFGLPDSAMPK